MIDALLYATRDTIHAAGLKYSAVNCDVMPDGHPRPGCGDVFLAVHQLASRQTADNSLDERFAVGVTLTMRCSNVAYDRIGDKLLAMRLAQEVGFNRRAEALRAFLHMAGSAWQVVAAANEYLVQMCEGNNILYGFCEPARYRGMEAPLLQGSEWFGAEEGAQMVGLKAMLRFEDARRMQGIEAFAQGKWQ